MRFDQDGRGFRVAGIPAAEQFQGLKASRVTRSWGFWGLRRRFWDFTGFKAAGMEIAKKRKKRRISAKKPEKRDHRRN
jgi:hypothetical protein